MSEYQKLQTKINKLIKEIGNTELFIKSYKWDISMQYDLNIMNIGKTSTALIWAIKRENHNFIKLLVRLEEDLINQPDINGETPLMIACRIMDTKIINFLLDNNANINLQNNNGDTSLIITYNERYSYRYNKKIIELLINKGINLNIKNNNGDTIFTIICKKNVLYEYDIDLIKILLKNGADPNIVSGNDISLLLILYMRNNIDLVKYILSNYNIDISILNSLKFKEFNMSYFDKQRFIFLILYYIPIRRIEQEIDIPIYFSWLCEYNKINLIKKIICNKSVDINIQDFCGATGLLNACRNKHMKLVKLLIKSGANINIQDYNQRTALIYSCINQDIKFVNLLIQNGADINIQDKYGCTALIYACRKYNKPLIKLLISNGADIDSLDLNNNSPFLLICKKMCDINMAKYFIDNGAQIDIQNKNGYTGFMYACKSRNLKLAEFLLSYNVNVNIMNNKYFTPLGILLHSNANYEFAMKLVEKGADINIILNYDAKYKFLRVNSKLYKNYIQTKVM